MIKVQKRNGQIIEFIPTRIIQAIASAFKEHSGLPREVVLDGGLNASVQKVADCVISVLNERASQRPFLTIEEIQDEVIRQLYENGFKEVGQRYATYRRYQASARKLFELYSIIKRDGKVVSFKQEKITLAIAKALIAQNKSVYNEILIEKAQELSDKVIDEITLRWPEGKSIHIEEVQDIVEKVIMASGYLEVAKRYILYRADRAKMRRNRPATVYSDASLEWIKDLVITDAEGKQSFLNLDALRLKLEICCQGLNDVSPREIFKESLKNYFNGMTSADLMQADIKAAKVLMEQEPHYSFAAARLLLLLLYQEALGKVTSFEAMREGYASYFISYIQKAVDQGLLEASLKQFDLKMLATAIAPERDFLFRYPGLQVLCDHYLIQSKGCHIELPQIFWMRVAMGLALREGADKNERVIAFYHILSTFRFLPSSMALFNAGKPKACLSAVMLSTIEDDLLNIFKSIQDSAFVFKAGGMVGNHWTNINHGVIPYLKMLNDACLAVNQSDKPRGSLCAYLEVWHWEIEDFVQLHKASGDERRRARDIHTAVWVPDLFMKRVKSNASWTLFAPSEVPELQDKYGKSFEARFEEYEQKARLGLIKGFKIIQAVHLWRKILTAALETGHPWIAWKDPCNCRSAQNHSGVVHSADASTAVLLNTQQQAAYCPLGAVNLALHVNEKGLDEQKLKETVTIAMGMLDNMVDDADEKRPVGLGIMGFQDALYTLNMGYACPEAVNFADTSMEAISYFALLADADLAAQRGAYASYKASPWERGLLPSDTIDMLEHQRGGFLNMDHRRSQDWVPVRKAIKQNGLRNSLMLSIFSTSEISAIAGVCDAIEPMLKNTVTNECLVNDLKKHGLWDKDMMDDLKYFEGSIQEITRIPDYLKAKYPTVFEIDYEWMIEAASRRQKWIDMSQSVNLYIPKPDIQKISDMYMLAWEKGLKTTFHLRCKGKNRIEKSVLNAPSKKIKL